VFDDDDAFVAECRRLLVDLDGAVTAGQAVFQANQEYWREGRGRTAVATLIQGPSLGTRHPGSPR
jgi:hypothetical protein